jgi:hypothetical protein
MARVILHVGSPKTGTTAIQRTLSKNRAALLREHGILYPEPAVTDGAAHHNLVYELGLKALRFKPALGGWGAIKDIVDNTDARTVVISAEGLLRLSRDIAPKLHSWAGHQFEVIIYFRRQDEYVEAGYNQHARFGRADLPPIEYFRELRPELLDYKAVIQSWEESIPQVTIRCSPYYKNIHIVPEFGWRFLSVPLSADQRVNTRAGLKAIRAIYRVRNYCRERIGSPYELRQKTVFQIHNMFRTVYNDIYEYSFLTRDEADDIMLRAESDNRWLASRFPGFDSSSFFDMTSSAPKGPFVRPGEGPDFTAEEAAAVQAIEEREIRDACGTSATKASVAD